MSFISDLGKKISEGIKHIVRNVTRGLEDVGRAASALLMPQVPEIKIPEIKTPEPPTGDEQKVIEARRKALRRGSLGRASTMLTGGRGATDTPLLGSGSSHLLGR